MSPPQPATSSQRKDNNVFFYRKQHTTCNCKDGGGGAFPVIRSSGYNGLCTSILLATALILIPGLGVVQGFMSLGGTRISVPTTTTTNHAFHRRQNSGTGMQSTGRTRTTRQSVIRTSSNNKQNDSTIATTTTTTTASSFATSSNSNALMPLRRGSAVALATPFDRHTGAIDLPAFRQLLQYHVTAGTDNLCLLGTTAEASVMTMAERAQILTTAVELVKGQIPIMVGCGTIDPSGVKDMIQQSIDLGADAALVVTPYYVKPPQRCLIQHFTNAAYMGLPIVIYNVPSRTGVDMSDESIAICALHDTIVGVKDATGKLERVQNLRDQLASTAATLQRSSTDSPFLLYSGDDATSMEFVLRGGDGCISVTANVAASSLHQIMSAALKGDADRANALNNPLLPLHDNLFCEANPIPVKYAMARVGLIPSAYCRPPLDFLDPSYESIVDSALRHAGLSIPNE